MCVSNWEKNDWEGTHLYDVYVFCILRKIQKAKLLSRITDGQLHELAAFWGHKISKTVTTSKSNFERLPSSQSYLKKKKDLNTDIFLRGVDFVCLCVFLKLRKEGRKEVLYLWVHWDFSKIEGSFTDPIPPRPHNITWPSQ